MSFSLASEAGDPRPSAKRRRIGVGLALLSAVLASCATTGPTREQILSDGVVTRSEYQMAGEQVVECLTRLGFEAEMEIEAAGAPSFTVRDEVGSERAFETCHGRHVGGVERAWADQNAPTPEEEARFYNSVVSCVESEIGEELGEYTGQEDTELLDELLEHTEGHVHALSGGSGCPTRALASLTSERRNPC